MRYPLCTALLLVGSSCVTDRQTTADTEPTNSRSPSQQKPADTEKKKRPRQYKRIHQKILRALLKGKLDKARNTLRTHLDRDPDDPEHWFLETLVQAKTGDIEAARSALRRAIELGLPPERFLAGPRDLLASIAETPELEDLHTKFRFRPVHGPMLGDLRASAVKVWMRTAVPASIEVRVRRADGGGEPIVASSETSTAQDLCGIVEVRGLAPATDYVYSVRVNAGSPTAGGTFRTFREVGVGGKLTIAFGGGAGYVPEHERMWDTIRSFRPDALLLLGDNVYIDAPRMRTMQDYCYYRRQSRPEFRKLVASTPVYTIWDDHDFGVNDCWYGPDPDKPGFKRKVLAVYRQNWANPAYGTDDVSGCFYEFHIGDLDFIMLDGRYYRSDPRLEAPSMLGAQQNEWLRGCLAEASGSFKMLCSPVPWVFEAKGDSRDTWNGFRDERDALFDFVRAAKIEGIVLLSADRHRTDIWNHDAEGHYSFPEFNSSRLTNQHVHPTMAKAEFSYNETQSFGLLEFDTTLADPTLTMKVINIDGEVLYTKVVRRSQLGYR